MQRRRPQLPPRHRGGRAAVDHDVGNGVRHLGAADGTVLGRQFLRRRAGRRAESAGRPSTGRPARRRRLLSVTLSMPPLPRTALLHASVAPDCTLPCLPCPGLHSSMPPLPRTADPSPTAPDCRPKPHCPGLQTQAMTAGAACLAQCQAACSLPSPLPRPPGGQVWHTPPHLQRRHQLVVLARAGRQRAAADDVAAAALGVGSHSGSSCQNLAYSQLARPQVGIQLLHVAA
jgi:hypothetical protein